MLPYDSAVLFHNLGHNPIRKPGCSRPVELSNGPKKRARGNLGGFNPGTKRFYSASFRVLAKRDADFPAFALLVRFTLCNHKHEALVRLGNVLNVEINKVTSPKSAAKADKKDSFVTNSG